MSDAIIDALRHHDTRMDEAEAFERAIELRAEDAYSDPAAVLQAAAWFTDSQDSPAEKATAAIIGRVLVAAMNWGRAFHENPDARILGDLAAAVVKAGRDLDMDPAFSDRMHANAEEWVTAQAKRKDYDGDPADDYGPE